MPQIRTHLRASWVSAPGCEQQSRPRRISLACLSNVRTAGARTRRRGGNLLFWNFVRMDAAQGFSLYARVSCRRQVASAFRGAGPAFGGAGVTSSRNWTALRLAGVESGENTPLFVGGRAFVMEPIN